ncbi:MAG: cation diffusion facilitator family transporter [Spirochaetaceae bacterium]
METPKTEKSEDRGRIIKRASIIGILGNGILSAAKLAGGFFGHSLSLIGDGIDSLTDVVTSMVTYYTAHIVDKPPDETHPYGHGRAETIATKVLSFVIFFAGAQLVLSTIEQLLSGAERGLPAFYALIIAGISVVGKIGLALNKYRAGKRAESSMLIADAKNMVMDVGISLSVLVGLLLTAYFRMPLLDTLIALVVGIWIMRVGFGIFMETNVELMDGMDDPGVYSSVYRAALEVQGVCNPHKMRIRKMNTKYVIDMDLEVDGGLTVQQGHEIVKKVQERVHREVPRVYDVHIHMEPFGNKERRERFGISGEDLSDTTDTP